MMRVLAWIVGLTAIIWAVVAGINWLTPRIEQDVSNRVNTVFAEKGLLFATAQTKGREVTVVGDAPDTEAHDKALSAAAQVFGVAKVMDGMSIDGKLVQAPVEVADASKMPEEPVAKPEATKDYRLVITKEAEHMTLTGMVPDEASRKVLMKLASDRYGHENVTDKLVVTKGAPEGWRSAAGAVLFNLSSLEKATATISNTEVMVDGEALDQEFADKAEDSMKKAMPTSYRVAYGVDVVEGDAPRLAKVESPSLLTVEDDGALAAIEPAAGEAKKEEPAKVEAKSDEGTSMLGNLWSKAGRAMGYCAEAKELSIHKVMFAFNSAKIAKVYDGTLDKVAGIMNGCSGLDVVVEGHTDHTGSGLYNQWLSEQRAEAGMRALMKRGVAKEHLSSKGYGETKPVGNNKTRTGRAANRRIDFVVDGPMAVDSSDDAATAADAPLATSPTASWWDRISGAIGRAETAVSTTVGK